MSKTFKGIRIDNEVITFIDQQRSVRGESFSAAVNKILMNHQNITCNMKPTFPAKEGEKLIGFFLLIEYPGCRKRAGDFEPLTTGDFRRYPKIWEPVYR